MDIDSNGFNISAIDGNLVLGGNKITGHGVPTQAQDCTTKSYVDSLVGGLSSNTIQSTSGNSYVTVQLNDSGIDIFVLSTQVA